MNDHMPPMICRRCGICCLADANAYITKDDRTRWKNEGREDILHLLEHEQALWSGATILFRQMTADTFTAVYFFLATAINTFAPSMKQDPKHAGNTCPAPRKYANSFVSKF